jgi:hypothetical protein
MLYVQRIRTNWRIELIRYVIVAVGDVCDRVCGPHGPHLQGIRRRSDLKRFATGCDGIAVLILAADVEG